MGRRNCRIADNHRKLAVGRRCDGSAPQGAPAGYTLVQYLDGRQYCYQQRV